MFIIEFVILVLAFIELWIRLVTSFLREYSEEWSIGRSYIQPQIIDSERMSNS